MGTHDHAEPDDMPRLILSVLHQAQLQDERSNGVLTNRVSRPWSTRTSDRSFDRQRAALSHSLLAAEVRGYRVFGAVMTQAHRFIDEYSGSCRRWRCKEAIEQIWRTELGKHITSII
jgi:hypothetical protein